MEQVNTVTLIVAPSTNTTFLHTVSANIILVLICWPLKEVVYALFAKYIEYVNIHMLYANKFKKNEMTYFKLEKGSYCA